jgi:DNA-binding transcriptional LysR family regulator
MIATMDLNVSERPGPLRFFQGDLQQLRCFYCAAVHRSFTRAAEELATGQPSVSNHIRQLEGVVGMPLFDRHRRRPWAQPQARS